MYLNENLTQAVTSLLQIRRGIMGREAEGKRLAVGQFYHGSPFLIDLLEKEYLGNPAYPGFEAFFLVPLDAPGML